MNVDPGINSFINAEFLQHDDPHYNCQQKVLNAHFGNCLIHTFAKTSMSTLTTHSSGTPKPCCEHCNPFTPPTCCDLHHAEITANMFDAQVGEMKTKSHPVHAKEHYAKDPTKSAELKETLYKWRAQEFSKQYLDCHNDPWTGDWIILPVTPVTHRLHTSVSDPMQVL